MALPFHSGHGVRLSRSSQTTAMPACSLHKYTANPSLAPFVRFQIHSIA